MSVPSGNEDEAISKNTKKTTITQHAMKGWLNKLDIISFYYDWDLMIPGFSNPDSKKFPFLHKMQVLFLWLLQLVASSSFHIKVGRYSSECYYENLKSSDRLEVSYEVTSSTAEYDIDYKITNPDGSKLHTVDRSKDASFGFNAGADGKHVMCFSNLHSGADKVISFIIIGPDDRLVDKAAADTPGKISLN